MNQNNNIDKQKLFDALAASSGGKFDANKLNSMVGKRDVSSLLSALSEEDKRKLNAAMADKESLQQLLNSPQAKMLMNTFLKGPNKNG